MWENKSYICLNNLFLLFRSFNQIWYISHIWTDLNSICIYKATCDSFLPSFRMLPFKNEKTIQLVIRSDLGQKYKKVLTIELLFARRVPSNNLFQIKNKVIWKYLPVSLLTLILLAVMCVNPSVTVSNILSTE